MALRIALVLCLLTPSVAWGEAPQIALSVEPQEVAVGEVIHWKVRIKHPPDVQVLLSKAASFGEFEVRDKAITKISVSKDAVEELLDVQLIAFSPGDIAIAPQQLTVVDKSGQVKELSTAEAKVKVRSLVGNEPQPKLKEDLGPGEQVIVKNYLLLWILGSILAVGAIASVTLLIRWLYARRKARPVEIAAPVLPPDRVALDKLEALRRSSLLEEGEIQEFYVRLSEAVREYVGGRFAFHSLELTSPELLDKLKRTPLAADDYQLMLDFLGDTDVVKFARVEPPIQESRALLEKSVGFVERTTLHFSRPVDEMKVEEKKIEQQFAEPSEQIEREIEKLSRDTQPVPGRERRPMPLKPPLPPVRAKAKEEPDTDPMLPAPRKPVSKPAPAPLPAPAAGTARPVPPPKLAPRPAPRPEREPTARMWHGVPVQDRVGPAPRDDEPASRDLDTEPAPPRPSRPVPLKKQPIAPKATPRAPARDPRDTDPVPPRPSRPVPLRKPRPGDKPESEDDDA